MNSFLFVVFLGSCALFWDVYGDDLCPEKCLCVEKAVHCVHGQLQRIPTLYLPNIVTLDLRFNQIRQIQIGMFENNQVFWNLTTVLLNNNYLTRLDDGAFSGVEDTLQVLDLYGNRLVFIHENVFEGFVKLEYLYLHSNNLKVIRLKTFENLPSLIRIFLNHNDIQILPLGSFKNSKKIQLIRLDNNPVNCSCDMFWILDFMLNSNGKISGNCYTPQNLFQKHLNLLTSADFNCIDSDVGNLQNIMLECDSESEVHWMRNSLQLTNNNQYTIFDNGSLLINSVDEYDFDQIECMVENDQGILTLKPKRTIVPNSAAPVFIEIPENVSVKPGANVFFNCRSVGMPKPEIYWSRNDVRILSDDRIFQEKFGGLHIRNVNQADFGTYRCHSVNSLGRVSVAAQLKVYVAPVFTIYPQSLDLQIGQDAVFECVAVGDPTPSIFWYRDDYLVDADQRYLFELNNSRFTIKNLQHTDAGVYVCQANNSLGFDDVSAKLTVRQSKKLSAPKLAIKPYNKEVLLGTTIEIPCKLDLGSFEDDVDLPEVTWRKDGTLLGRNSRYRISEFGSLYITNFVDEDIGRYECSVLNEAGQDSGQALISVKPRINLKKVGDQYVKAAFSEAQQEVDRAINNTLDSMFNRKKGQKLDSTDLFRLFRYPNAPARELAKAAEIYDRTLLKIREFVESGHNVTYANSFDYKDILSQEHLNMIAELSGCMSHRQSSNCTDICYHRKYRSISGLCNNFANPTWGASLTSFRRVLKPVYENGFSTPVGWNKSMLYYGYAKPSSRLISTTLISTNKTTFDDLITHMVMQWGQFLDHDLDHAIPSVSSETWGGIDCKKSCDFAAPCYPIEVPIDDERIKNRRCIDFFRSSAICGSGSTSVFFNEIQVREQINQPTAFIDGSQVYGFSDDLAANLRDGTGRLREGLKFRNKKPLLPFSNGLYGMDCRRNFSESSVDCFLAGDIRVNEQIGLTAMHTIWMREHNRVADELRIINPHWPAEVLYQEARKVVGAEMQHVTYQHWLPLIIGEEGVRMLGQYRGYNPTINPSISNVFATAALRFGHTLINPIINRYDADLQNAIPEGHLPLHKGFFAPWRLTDEGGIDPIIRGLFLTPAKLKEPDRNLNSELTEKLFQVAHAVALDLAAINIQRARDHGLPGYLEYRKFCNLSVSDNFDNFDPVIRSKLRNMYGHPGNIDVWVGGILEDALPGAKVGPLFRCLLIEQFQKLRDGDRFYYEYPATFRHDQLVQIQQTSLARIICDNADNISHVPMDVFVINNDIVACNKIAKVDLRFWAECCETCSGNLAVGRNKREINGNLTFWNNDLIELKRNVDILNEKFNELLKLINK